MQACDRLEALLLTAAESERFTDWDDALSALVQDILSRYSSDELDEETLFLAAGGTASIPRSPDDPNPRS